MTGAVACGASPSMSVAFNEWRLAEVRLSARAGVRGALEQGCRLAVEPLRVELLRAGPSAYKYTAGAVWAVLMSRTVRACL